MFIKVAAKQLNRIEITYVQLF